MYAGSLIVVGDNHSSYVIQQNDISFYAIATTSFRCVRVAQIDLPIIHLCEMILQHNSTFPKVIKVIKLDKTSRMSEHTCLRRK